MEIADHEDSRSTEEHEWAGRFATSRYYINRVTVYSVLSCPPQSHICLAIQFGAVAMIRQYV